MAKKKTVWKEGLITKLLHRVGDDWTKSDIEDALAKAFKDQPDVLNKIADIFVKACPTDDEWYAP